MNRLTNLVWKAGGNSLASFAYTLGVTGNRTALAETVNGAPRSYAWVYDYLYRLTGETIGGTAGTAGTLTYGYDPVGNRTNRTSTVTGISPQSNTFTANDWLGSDQYDPNGNTTNSGAVAYQYDALNHLTNVNHGQITLAYDGDGNRVKKTVSSTGTTYYLADDRNPSGYAQVVEEWTAISGATNLSRVYNYGLSLISQRQMPGGTVSYYGTDGHDSTRFLANTGGAITDTYTYDAYGVLIAYTGTTPNDYLYAGQQWDSDLGMYYNRARYLNPNTGRFWTMDTYEGFKQVPASLHKYLYCQADPINRTDPSGRASTLAAQNGTAVHQYIGQDFVGKVPGGFSGPSVVNVLRDAGIPIRGEAADVVTALFPDLTDTIKQEVYEIKLDNVRSIALGEAQLEAYIDLFNYLDPRGGWHRGTSYSPPLTVPINALNYAVAVGSPVTPPGMILYKVFSVQQIVKRKVVQTAVAENAETDADVGIATLNSLMGAF